ncbi:tyrosine-type recombinase/integrase [Spirosoma sp. HMF4905]|uniref:Tyrosine-type recombinase/integrase n=1 Tax=Spirosoma arboris TaxID=2682092 RepID=A0A7K1SJP8_9BACT|nr:site-specific integrase [Spirosoma arboris]MVM34030.1 tyrosine-type recombinase/integrase [Spirosoma arboris]
MKVTLREKKISGGRKSLYLDFYPPIPNPETSQLTRREFLGLYLFEKPRTEPDKLHNWETKELAARIVAQRQVAIQNGAFGFVKSRKTEVDFVSYVTAQVDAYKGRSKGARNSWRAMAKRFEKFAGGKLLTKHLTAEFCNRFRDSLMNEVSLAQNSKANYFQHFKTTLRRAVDDGTLTTDFLSKVKRIPIQEVQREFLGLEELTTLSRTDCDRPDLKQAALFSALTGLRFSDIAALTWQQVKHDETGYSLRFTTRKTQMPETLPITEQARQFLGDEGQPTARVFPRLNYSEMLNKKLAKWLDDTGITRPVTFHCFRHTFATLQLQQGTDIYTVSKLLGHKKLLTTQVYAKVVDSQKRTAVNRLKIEL